MPLFTAKCNTSLGLQVQAHQLKIPVQLLFHNALESLPSHHPPGGFGRDYLWCNAGCQGGQLCQNDRFWTPFPPSQYSSVEASWKIPPAEVEGFNTAGAVSATKISEKVPELNLNISSQKHDTDLCFFSFYTHLQQQDH
jgi:hypothetical protein